MTKQIASLFLMVAATSFLACCKRVQAMVNLISSEVVEEAIGSISLADSPEGLVITPDLKGLPPGERGFHFHEKPDCGPGEDQGHVKAGFAAGPHYDPHEAGHHDGPEGKGHQGDLPKLEVSDDGIAKTPVTAPRLKLTDVRGRALMIHEGGDNYADNPEPAGGGGARIACAIIP
jgi:superoxide dismutase, Cu-Zn family